MAAIKRQMASDILEAAKFFPVIGILGPRQSGKTTLAQEVFKNYRYVSLEDIDMRNYAQDDPRKFLQIHRNEHGLILDEFQHVPDILSYIQTIVDAEKKPASFILTGSQNFLVNEKISQTLAGRISLHTLLPFSVEELISADKKIDSLDTLLYHGLYPRVQAEDVPPERWYPNYIQTYLERDVRQIKQVTNLSLFQKFIQLCAGRVGQVLNYTALSNACDISVNTAKAWISLLEASYIIFLLQPHHKNFNKRITKSPKLYFFDPGLVCMLLKISPEQLALSPFYGGIFESFVISEIAKNYYNTGKRPSIYFWREQDKHEVDCIIETGSKLIPIEIKSSMTISSKFFDGLKYWNQLSGTNPSDNFIVYGGNEYQERSHGTIVTWNSIANILKKIS